jgi:hypothetical protein
MERGLLARAASPFAALFGGQGDPRLGPDANKQALRDAVLMAGLTTVQQASQPGASALGSLATGAMQGQATGAGRREQLVQQDGREQLAQLAAGGVDIPTAQRMLVQAMSTGDMETVKYLSAVLTSMQAAQPNPVSLQRQETTHPETGQRVIAAFDPRTGRYDFTNAVPAPAETSRFLTVQRPDDDQPYVYAVDPVTGAPAARVGLPLNTGAGAAGAGQKNQNLAGIMSQAEETLSQYDAELANPIVSVLSEWAREGGVFGTLANVGLQAISPEGQMASAARDRWVSAFVPILSGATMTELERTSYRVAFTPVGGDSETVQDQKAQARALAAIMFSADPSQLDRSAADQILQKVGLSVPVVAEPNTNPFMRPRGN